MSVCESCCKHDELLCVSCFLCRQLLESVDIFVLPEDIGDAPEYTEDKENQSYDPSPPFTDLGVIIY